jgi:hypothetical protein
MSTAERSQRSLAILVLASLVASGLAVAGCSGEGEVVQPSAAAKAKSKDYIKKKFQDYDERKAR